MEVFGGFMVMMSILSFFLAVVWLVMPFVVFTIKGKLDRTLDVLSGIENRLSVIETRLAALDKGRMEQDQMPAPDAPLPSPDTEIDPPETLPLA
ncbi:hypothetical protein [Pelotalea chapellei]|uniref:Phage shock protein B n=1 Tax=Pelotalea chapellei TaxID=44671 RepID=A0ABS5UBX1_9BACT|nr:hypothetical protein [Pelotalea chapellei]MBT1073164.1 hypothetical protein [Pelotalea chapellei]